MRAFVSIVLGIAFFIVGYAVFQTVRASGRVTYCYVLLGTSNDWHATPFYRVYGHRDWRPDVTLAGFNTLREAMDGAAQLGCPLAFGIDP